MLNIKSIVKDKIYKFVNHKYSSSDAFGFKDNLDLQMIHRFYSRYHPLTLEGGAAGSKRNVMDRAELIRPNLIGHSCLDIGCQAGFFSFILSSDTMWLTGVDRDPIILKKANLLKKKFNKKNVDFKKMEITEETLATIPSFDNTLYLSIHHHMIKVYGYQRATEILKVIASKTTRLFFDFPYYKDVKDIKLFSEIPDMGDNPHEWMESYLKSAGFSKVTLLGVLQHPEKTHEKRPLFMAER